MRTLRLFACIAVAGLGCPGIALAGVTVNYTCQGGTQFVVEYAADGKTALVLKDMGRQQLKDTALTTQSADAGILFTGQPPIVVNDPRFKANEFAAVQLEASLVRLTGAARDKIELRQGRRSFQCEASSPIN